MKEGHRNRWILHIKHLRAERDIGLLEAERIVLADPEWRRWVEHRINTDDQCRRMAFRHVRESGANALIEIGDDRLRVISDDRA
jgi:hypothetical protein